MPSQTVFAVAIALLGAVCFSLGASLQHHVVKNQAGDDGGVSIKQILSNLSNLPWTGGLVLILVGTVLHIWALAQAPVTLIQPLGILAVPITIATAPWFRGHKPTPREIAAVTVTVLAVFGFAWAASGIAGKAEPAMSTILWSIGIVTAGTAGLGLWARQSAGPSRSIAWSLAGGICYGFASGLLKAALNLTQQGQSWFSALVVVSLAGIVLNYLVGAYAVQQAYSVGKPETVLAVLTSLDPCIAVLFGFVALGETGGITAVSSAAMVLTAVIAVAGTVVLSQAPQHHTRKHS